MSKKVLQSMDGNQAAAYTAYAFTEVAGIYPITPSSVMPEYIDEWAKQGKKNLFGTTVKVVEMQSEAGAAAAVHGALQTGAMTTTFTASQGLLLKIPNMYKIAGELLPGVIHVAARSIAAQALSIFGDHQDVMAARQTGFAMLCSSSVQEVMDLGGVAHLAAVKSSLPFVHFFDGFRTSHEIQSVEVMDYEVFDRLLDREAVKDFRQRALNPARPVTRGTAQNDDVYFQTKEVTNKYYNELPDIVNNYLQEISKVTGRNYAPFTYYGDKEATDVIVAMGSVVECTKEVVDYLRENKHKKVGVLSVRLYRPFSSKYFFEAMPETVKRIAVLDRTKESGSVAEPLKLDVMGVYYGRKNAPIIIGGRYGLSSKDTTPGQIFAVFDNLAKGNKAKKEFTIGIVDDVTNLSLPITKEINVGSPNVSELIFYGLGSDGTVGANKSTIKLIGDHTEFNGQAYFAYDSRKSGGVTRSNLRFSPDPIRSTYLVRHAGFISCSLDSYTHKFDMLRNLKPGGTFLLNTVKNEKELIEYLPNSFKISLAKKKVKFYVIDAVSLAAEIGLGNRTNTIMQSAFFKLNEQIMPYEKAKDLMKQYALKSYGKKGDAVVQMNYLAIEKGAEGLKQIKVKPSWAKLEQEKELFDKDRPDFVSRIADKINALKGDDLPVSTFEKYDDGTMSSGTTDFEKRYIASFVSSWNPDNCIQCNQCSFVCPHAVIRPFLATEEELANAPEGTVTLKANGKGFDGLQYAIQVSIADCTGCGVCINQCPGKKGEKALSFAPIEEEVEKGKQEIARYFYENVTYKDDLIDKMQSPKNSQFAQPLFEFSGACAGCGETPYIKLVTQLFGERMVIANATGCSSIYGGSYPMAPYTTNKKNQRGPAWANSLFEDNAEFGFGMEIAANVLRSKVAVLMEKGLDDVNLSEELKSLFTEWLENKEDGQATLKLYDKLVPALEKSDSEIAKELLENKDYIIKRSQWIIGGDGWAYDIGFGGLDHVIANQEDVNILVLDTEVYSNTGGQSSKSSQTGSIAKFTAGGKTGMKKDLGAIAMTYGHVYVASIAHGASQMQMLKAMKEAESYPGPSILIAYSPCISHGISGGLYNSQMQAKTAVEVGYWPLYRFDPRRITNNENPFVIDSKEPNWDKYEEHLLSEARYAMLKKANPNEAEKLLAINKEQSQKRYRMYQRYAAMDYSK